MGAHTGGGVPVIVCGHRPRRARGLGLGSLSCANAFNAALPPSTGEMGITAGQRLVSPVERSRSQALAVTLTAMYVFPMTHEIECVALLEQTASDVREICPAQATPMKADGPGHQRRSEASGRAAFGGASSEAGPRRRASPADSVVATAPPTEIDDVGRIAGAVVECRVVPT